MATGGPYTFEIEEKEDGIFDVNISSHMGTDVYWQRSLNGAKDWIRKEYEGIEFTRFKQVSK